MAASLAEPRRGEGPCASSLAALASSASSHVSWLAGPHQQPVVTVPSPLSVSLSTRLPDLSTLLVPANSQSCYNKAGLASIVIANLATLDYIIVNTQLILTNLTSCAVVAFYQRHSLLAFIFRAANYCQAEVQSKSSPTPNSKSKLRTPNSNSRLDWSDTIIIRTTHPPTHHPPTTHPTHPPITFQALLEVIPPSVIPFWKPLMTLYKNCNSVAKFVQKRKKEKKERSSKRKSSQLIFRLTPSTPV